MASATQLSRNDKSVLSALFDAESKPSQDVSITSQISTPSPAFIQLQQLEAQAIRPLNADTPSDAQISLAIEQLTLLIKQRPEYASAYNNRAQATRMLVGDDLLDIVVCNSTLYSDLSTAISIATTSQDDCNWNRHQVLASAYTHRGHVLYKASKLLSKDQSSNRHLKGSLEGADGPKLETLAANDFRLGGKFGNDMAKEMAVQLNPMARLCGEIVREAMISDMKESGVVQDS